MSVPDLASFIAAPDRASDPKSVDRLERSAEILNRNIDSLVDRVLERCPSIQIAQAGDHARAQVLLKSFLALVLDHASDLSEAQSEIASLGTIFPDPAQSRVTIVAQMAAIASYTWTTRHSMDWTRALALTMSWTETPVRQSA